MEIIFINNSVFANVLQQLQASPTPAQQGQLSQQVTRELLRLVREDANVVPRQLDDIRQATQDMPHFKQAFSQSLWDSFSRAFTEFKGEKHKIKHEIYTCYLIELGADVNFRPIASRTSLERATERNLLGCAEILLQYGAHSDQDAVARAITYVEDNSKNWRLAELLKSYRRPLNARPPQSLIPA